MKQFVVFLYFLIHCEAVLNDRPIIGVLSQELTDMIADNYGDNYVSYIAASYIKHLESAGARVVPVWINQTSEYYEYIVNSVNGLVIPGGAAPFNASDGYATAGKELYNLAKQKNEEGVNFPVLGVCLGFELLAVLSADEYDLRSICDIQNVALPLNFSSDYKSSRMYKDASDEMVKIMQTENVTINFHHWCITDNDLAEGNVSDQWHVLSYSEYNGTKFVSSFEHTEYPFYGYQFHPEKNTFEWKITNNNPHTANAVLVEQYYGSFIVNEARKNNNSFPNFNQEMEALIYNYSTSYTTHNTPFEQIYFFPRTRSNLQVYNYHNYHSSNNYYN
ncbi:hypothetical protein L9F63_022426 [Diploptera punctata]|uniref:folate gamma-glutamyl hydrolase n=1 Tax=Diploptera punctata TaxID=6984 RepID=A0AAD7ZMS3_DIPPU|nr:hypothetical protein L9F63_022426 [Diploptera punctata]